MIILKTVINANTLVVKSYKFIGIAGIFAGISGNRLLK